MKYLLDDLTWLKEIDKGGMCDIQERFPENCETALENAEKLRIPKKIVVKEDFSINYEKPQKIIIAGMGGSAIGGNILKDWLRDIVPIPIEVCRDYHLPAYADEKTLVLAISYSGNTEETLNMLIEAIEKRCMIITISSNGVLKEFSQKIGIPCIKLPKGFPPRSAIPYLFFSLAVSLKKIRVLESPKEEFNEAINVLKQVREDIRLETTTADNIAKRIALDLYGSIPVIYGFGIYKGVAQRIKTQFNENAKCLSFYACFPELNHNETVGWTGKGDLADKFVILLIRDKEEPLEIMTRIDVTKKMVFDERAKNVIEVFSKGKSNLAKILSTIFVGDFVSIYLAFLYGIDPTPVKIIDKLKEQLEKRVHKVSSLKKELDKIIAK
jgi:glucose/mannose-6-phosphate isomerase